MNKRKLLPLSIKAGGWLMLVFLSLSISHAPPAFASPSLLSFRSNDHILGFNPNGYYLSNGTYVFNTTFIAANPTAPQSHSAHDTNSAPTLTQVTYSNLWPGINLHYDQGDGLLRSTYTLAANADPDSIRLGYNVPAQLNPDGSLHLIFSTGTLVESKPIAWQVIDGQHIPVAVSFHLTHRDKTSSEVSFKLGDYDKHHPLWLDPTLTWNTFLGGDGDDEGLAIALDNNNHVYVAGSSATSWGTPVRTYRGITDGFVAQLNAITGELNWNTFLGSGGTDKALDIFADDDGNIYVAGYSNASWGAPTGNHSGDFDAFAARLDAATGALAWNAFLGGGGVDRGWSITADNGGNVYMTGVSNSSWGNPVRPFSANRDAFVAKLDAADGSFGWNTFLGGDGFDRGLAIATNGDGFVYATGASTTGWGSPIRAYTGDIDGFAVQLNGATGLLNWNTFLGGSGVDESQTMFLDESSHLYISGFSNASWGNPTRPYSGGYDAFATRLNADGVLSWNTFLGAGGDDFGSGIHMGGNNDIYIGGVSNLSWGNPIRAYTAGNDAFATRVDSTTGTLIWNTFIGGNDDEQGQDLAVDSSGNIFSVGTGMATWGSPVRSYTAGTDAFVANIPPPCIQSAGSGLWSSSSSWAGGIVPLITEGACILDDHTITLDTSPQVAQLTVEHGGTLAMPIGFSLTAENFVYSDGIIEQTQLVNNASVSFLEISNIADTAVKYRGADVTSTNDLGAVTVRVRELGDDEYCTSDAATSPPYAQRCYEITAENNLPATVRLWSLMTDLNDIAVANLSVYRWVDPNWLELTINRTTGTDGASYAYAEGDTPGFSSFLLGQQGLGPTAVTLNSLTTAPNSPATLFLLFLLFATLSLLTWHKYKKRFL